MKVQVKIQGEDIVGERSLRLNNQWPVARLKLIAEGLRRSRAGDELFLFEENGKQPLCDRDPIPSGTKGMVRLHLHRCRHVHVTVSLAGETHARYFSPGTTFARILLWAQATHSSTTQETGLTEPGLRIAGTQTQPDLHAHVGIFVDFPFCEIALDLMVSSLSF